MHGVCALPIPVPDAAVAGGTVISCGTPQDVSANLDAGRLPARFIEDS